MRKRGNENKRQNQMGSEEEDKEFKEKNFKLRGEVGG